MTIWRNINKAVLAKNFNEEILTITGQTMEIVIERTVQTPFLRWIFFYTLC